MKNRNSFLIDLEVRKFKIKMLAHVMSGEGLTSVSQMETFAMYSHDRNTHL
jgi:hypothetical protein